MICPKCANERTKVVGTVKGMANERFRRCPQCGYSFQTVEAIKFDDYWREYAKDTLETNDKSFPETKDAKHDA